MTGYGPLFSFDRSSYFPPTLNGLALHVTDGAMPLCSRYQSRSGHDAPAGNRRPPGVDYSSGGRSQRIRGRMPMNNQAANLEQYEASRAWRGRRYHGDQATSHRIKYLVTRPS
jgi:hypothetical protein